MRRMPLVLLTLVLAGCEQMTGVRPLEHARLTSCANPLEAGDHYLQPLRSELAYPTSFGTIRYPFGPGHCVTWFDSLATRGTPRP